MIPEKRIIQGAFSLAVVLSIAGDCSISQSLHPVHISTNMSLIS